MRVLATVPNYLPTRIGAWIATHQLLRELAARGHDVVVFAWQRRERGYEIDGVTVETGLQGKSHGHRLATGADVVLSHFGDDGLGATVAAEAGRPSVRLAHGGGPHGPMGCDLAVFNSHSLRTAWTYDRESIVVYPSIDPAEHTTTPGDHVTIVNCSTPKGVMTAWRIAEEMPTVNFLGVLGGYGDQVRPRARNFEVIQPTQNMRSDVWSRTRILLMPSAYETWGMVGIEAMCSGIPVIAHPTPGLLESLGDAGIFADRDDTRGWVNAIKTLDDPADYRAASKRAKTRVRELVPEMRAGLDRFANAVEAFA